MTHKPNDDEQRRRSRERALQGAPKTVSDRARDILSRVVADRLAKWRLLAGDRFEELLKSRKRTEDFLNHSEPGVRLCAFQMLAYYWKHDLSIAERCQEAIIADSDPRVSIAAIACLGECCRRTRHQEISSFLSKMIKDGASSLELRAAAYRALLTVCGSDQQTDFILAQCKTEKEFADKVDWHLVNSFLA